MEANKIVIFIIPKTMDDNISFENFLKKLDNIENLSDDEILFLEKYILTEKDSKKKKEISLNLIDKYDSIDNIDYD